MALRMDMGDGGRLRSFTDNLRKLESYGSFPTMPIEQALAEVQAGENTLNLDFDRRNPTVKNVEVFSYSDSYDRRNGLLMPVYAFTSSDFCIYVPAVNPQ